MSNEENKYSFDLCKRRGIKTTLHPIVTDPKLLKDMTRKHVAAQNKGSRKTRKEDIQQPAPYHLQIYTYEQLLQHYRNFFMTGPLMRCLDGDKNMDKKSVGISTWDFLLTTGAPWPTSLTSHDLGKRTPIEITRRCAKNAIK